MPVIDQAGQMWWKTRNRSDPGTSLKSRLLAGLEISEPVAVLVAHPDDEIIGMGGRISALKTLTLIHATDGAPKGPAKLQQNFRDEDVYSSKRFAEVDQALDLVGARPIRHVRYDYTDGELAWKLIEMVRHLELQLQDVSAVITHPYEGGHPDHDACAFAAQHATRRLKKSGYAVPARLEFTSYFSANGRRRVGTFWPDKQNPGASIRLTRDQRQRKLEALRAFETQGWVPRVFGVRREMYRDAPDYDFRRPPAPQRWLYDTFGWPITGQIWLRHAASALDQLSRFDQ